MQTGPYKIYAKPVDSHKFEFIDECETFGAAVLKSQSLIGYRTFYLVGAAGNKSVVTYTKWYNILREAQFQEYVRARRFPRRSRNDDWFDRRLDRYFRAEELKIQREIKQSISWQREGF